MDAAPDTSVATRAPRVDRGPWVAAGGAALACVVVAVVDPTQHQVTPLCPLQAATGWWCPFCGATRAASRLLRGDVVGALGYNAAFVVLLPLVIVAWVAWAFPDRTPALDPLRRSARRIGVVVGVLLAAFMVARNLPFAQDWLRHTGA